MLAARRTIEELATRYELEPSLQDFYVEGAFDKDVLAACFEREQLTDKSIYEIDTIDLPDETFKRHGLTPGQKQRVLILARELAILKAPRSYRCLVDRDLDHWFGDLETTPRLLWTKWCSIELYFFTDELLRDILLTTANCRIADWSRFLQSFVDILQRLYAFRLADREMGLALNWLPVKKCLIKKEGRVVINDFDYVTRVLNQSQKFANRQQLLDTADAWIPRLVGDFRLYVRGHDFVEILAWTVRAFGGKKELTSEEVITRLFVLLAKKTPELVWPLE